MSIWKKIITVLLILAAFTSLMTGSAMAFSSAEGTDVRGMVAVGERYLSEERYEEAVEVFSKAIDVEPKYVPTYVDRAITYAVMGDNEKALADYATAIELEPEREEELSPNIEALKPSKSNDELEIDARKQAEEQKEKDNLKAILSKSVSKPIQEFHFGDYDSDGKYEAFAVVADKSADETGGFYNHVDLYYVSDSGATLLKSDTYGFAMDDSTNGQQCGNVTVNQYSFFVFEQSAGGSGSISHIWGVKDHKVVEMNISEYVESFCQDKDSGKITGCQGNFLYGYHQYVYYKYIFDEASFTFVQSDLDHID